MSYYMSIDKNKVKISRSHRDAFPYTVKSVADYNDYIATEAKNSGIKPEDIVVMASSSMDFPNEFTNNAETIALAKALREGEGPPR